MAEFWVTVFAGGSIAFVIGEVIGGLAGGGSHGFPPLLGFLVWPLGAIGLPIYMHAGEKRRRRRQP